MAVSQRLRYEVLRRDNHACRYCGATAPDVKLTVDHVIPVALGGTDEPGNLVTACKPCNSGKAATAPDAPVVDDVSRTALRWKAAMEIASRAISEDRAARDEFRDGFLQSWRRWTYTWLGQEHHFELEPSWTLSIDRFVAAGLNWADLEEAINETMRRDGVKDRWRYFCGVAWGIVKHKQEIALEIAAGMDAIDAEGVD